MTPPTPIDPSNTEACVKAMMEHAMPAYQRSLEQNRHFFQVALVPHRNQGVFSDDFVAQFKWGTDWDNRRKAFRMFEERLAQYIFNDQHVKVKVEVSNFVAGDDLSQPVWGWSVIEVEGFRPDPRPRGKKVSIKDWISYLLGN